MPMVSGFKYQMTDDRKQRTDEASARVTNLLIVQSVFCRLTSVLFFLASKIQPKFIDYSRDRALYPNGNTALIRKCIF